MAFPTIAGAATTDGSAAAVDPSINLPSGLVSGDLCIVFFTANTTHNNPTAPTGWTYLVSAKPAGDTRSGDRDQILYRFCDGTEGTTLTIDTGTSSVKHRAIAYRITGVDDAIAPQISAAGVGTSNAPDPASVTPTGGPKDFLFLALAAQEGAGGAPSVAPTSYTHHATFTIATSGGGGATNGRSAVAYRELNTSSAEDPAAWGAWGASEDWAAWTIVVHPASGDAKSGSGSLATSASPAASGSKAATAGTGSLSSSASPVASATTQRSTTGALSATATPAATARKGATDTGSIALVSTLAGSGSAQQRGTGALSASATLTASGTASEVETHEGTGTLSASAALSASAIAGRAGVGAQSSSATLVASGAPGRADVESLALSASLAASGTAARSGAGALTTTATLAGVGMLVGSGAGSVTLSAALSGAGASQRLAAATLAELAELVATGEKHEAGTVSGTGVLTLSASLSAEQTTQRSSSSSASATLALSAEGSAARSGAAAIVLVATLAAVQSSALIDELATATVGFSDGLTSQAMIDLETAIATIDPGARATVTWEQS